MAHARILVVYDPNVTDGDDLARELTEALGRRGIRSEACEADDVGDLDAYDAVAVETARDGSGWTGFARDFARRHMSELSKLPAWFLPREQDTRGVPDRTHADRWARAIAARLQPADARALGVTRPLGLFWRSCSRSSSCCSRPRSPSSGRSARFAGSRSRSSR